MRVRDAARTRAKILSKAQEVFAKQGYAQSGVREIAGAAGVDPALIRRYFVSKEGLFEASLAAALDVTDLIATSRENFGRHIASYLIDESHGHPNPLPMLMMAMADPDIRSVALTMLQQRVVAPLAEWIGGPEADQRAARISMLCSGFMTYVRLLPLEIYAEGVDPFTRDWLEKALQAAVDA